MSSNTQGQTAETTPVPNPYNTAANALMEQARAMRQQVPNFVFPTTKSDGRRLNTAANLPPQFVELTNVAVTFSAPLARNGAPDPVQSRDLVKYAEAFAPFADELEALAKFVRHSIAVAKNKVGRDALITYALAKRLASIPETADLAPHVDDMSRALGKRGRKAKPQTAPGGGAGSPVTPAKPA